jgi:hypothetical protein
VRLSRRLTIIHLLCRSRLSPLLPCANLTDQFNIFRGLSFETSATEGAILTLPEGAFARDLENIPRIRAYAAANVESWYRYINGPRGREAKNGEVRLVIGCDKTTAWGMAAVSSQNQHKVHLLKYCSIEGGHNTTSSPIPLYKWECSGYAVAQVGPGLQEIEDLKRNDASEAAVRGKYRNQGLFLRTLNLTLNDEVFAAISQELELKLIQETQQQHPEFPNFSHSLNNSSNTGESQSSSTSHQQSSGTKFRTHRASASVSPPSIVGQRVTTSLSPSVQVSLMQRHNIYSFEILIHSVRNHILQMF